MQTYYNTNGETGETLKGSKKKANRQQDEVLNIFKVNANKLLCADEIYTLGQFKAPLTSIRRAISNLASEGYLVKTDHQKMGGYGKLTYCYKYQTVEPVKF